MDSQSAMEGMLSAWRELTDLPVGALTAPAQAPKTRTKPLTEKEKFATVIEFEKFRNKDKGKIPKGFRVDVVDHFEVSPQTIDSITSWWKSNSKGRALQSLLMCKRQ